MSELAAPATARQDITPPPPSFDTEVVREFEPRVPEAAPPVPSGAGFAPAEPVRIEWPSDLVQVESDPGKIQTVQEQEPEQQAVPRPKRARPPAQQASQEPLVQIETGQPGGS
jgi:hypothetical protein